VESTTVLALAESTDGSTHCSSAAEEGAIAPQSRRTAGLRGTVLKGTWV
jgi:hypothetical protein